MPRHESGDGWELVRQFVPGNVAVAAGEQMQSLLETEGCVTSYRRFKWHPVQTTVGVHKYLVTNVGEFAQAAGYGELQEVNANLNEIAFGPANLVNKYDPLGVISRHVDYEKIDYRFVQDGLALALSGIGYATLHGKTNVRLRVEPGDLFRTYNQGRTVPVRAEHSFRAGPKGRLSFGY